MNKFINRITCNLLQGITLILFLYTPCAWSDGETPPDEGVCIFLIEKYKVQMTIYQPDNYGELEFCQKIPLQEITTSIAPDSKNQNTIIIFDLLDEQLREMEIKLNIIKENDDLLQTLVSIPAQKYLSGTVHFDWKLPSEKGKYLISLEMNDSRNTYSKQIPLELGSYSKQSHGKSLFVPVIVTISILLLIIYTYRLKKSQKSNSE